MLIETARLILRDFRTDDFEAFYSTTTDPEYRKYYPELETTRDFYRRLFDRFVSSAEGPNRKIYQLAVCLKEGDLIGTCGVRMEAPSDQQASFGCALARAYWGQGMATEASRRLLEFGFSSPSIHRIYAETISENSRARALVEHLGFRLEGEFRDHQFFNGRWWNTVVYAVLKDEWGPSVTPPLR